MPAGTTISGVDSCGRITDPFDSSQPPPPRRNGGASHYAELVQPGRTAAALIQPSPSGDVQTGRIRVPGTCFGK